MSSATPNKRLQLKTSDLADFFRGSSTGLSSTNSGRSTTLIDENRLSTSSSPSRKRSTRIPFIGRPRKKSVHSDVAPSVASEARESRSSVATGSGSILEQPNSVVALHASTSQHSLHSTSLGSKIVARFTPSKSRSSSKPQSRKSQLSAKTQEELSDYTSDSLVSPSLAPRSPSIDSKFSRVSRSSTPRASQANEKASGGGGLHPQPTITVSRPPVDNLDNMDQYEDLFTKPPRRIKQKPVPVDTRPLASLSREPPLRDTLCPSPPPSAISLATPTISRTPSVSARAPAPTAADIIRRSATISRMHKLSYSPAPSPSDSNNVPIPGSSSSIRRGTA
ncbi:hypothetical protein BDP27DRAFT_1417390 [Rhodocollybia butyracea]|uniref:Uncharacterized protein n=1 Tax=Rhodocollybia butyracea TaxID=206335 RepID=A0A9P5PVK1_9AGAR|nr:hypothetical protein BDP27DRAFT_1417390 [Rhodocollybia butyracea]